MYCPRLLTSQVIFTLHLLVCLHLYYPIYSVFSLQLIIYLYYYLYCLHYYYPYSIVLVL